MGCNAWNHAPDCDCGWGGTFYGHSEGVSQALAWPLTTGSWITPNARCPVCNAEVFFYKSPTGGRVYFDALGAPWPKHPCVSGGAEVPDSAFWRAFDIFVPWKRNVTMRGGLSVLGMSNKKFAAWFVENGFMRSIRNHKYPPTVAFWVLHVPYEVLGDVDVDLWRIKKPMVLTLARRILHHFEARPPRGLDQRVCLETAQALVSAQAAQEKRARSSSPAQSDKQPMTNEVR